MVSLMRRRREMMARPSRVLYNVDVSLLRRKYANAVTRPYYSALKTRISYSEFDLRLTGGKSYRIHAISTDGYSPQMGLQFYTDKILAKVSENTYFSSSDIYDPGWQDMDVTISPPQTWKNSPVAGVRITFRQASSNPTISDGFSILKITIEEV